MTVVPYFKKKIYLFCSLIGVFLGSAQAKETDAMNSPFYRGERLEYQAYYSFIHAGTATMYIDEELHKLNKHYCYKIQVKGTSSKGLEFLGMKIADSWESYLDTDLLLPRRFLSHIQENSYTREEKIDFDYQINEARVEVSESTNNMQQEVTYYPISNENKISDLISSYYSLRTIDSTKLRPGDNLVTHVLYENRVYNDVAIIYMGRKTITTKLGKIATLVFVPKVPTEDGIFCGDRPVEVFISDDANKIPIKLKVNLVVGALEIELTSYQGLKEALVFQKP